LLGLPRVFREAEESAPLLTRCKMHDASMKQFCAYIMSNKSRRLYTGLTSDLVSRALLPAFLSCFIQNADGKLQAMQIYS
jgi:hypothetical protein